MGSTRYRETTSPALEVPVLQEQKTIYIIIQRDGVHSKLP